jgi:hypothetical protein
MTFEFSRFARANALRSELNPNDYAFELVDDDEDDDDGDIDNLDDTAMFEVATGTGHERAAPVVVSAKRTADLLAALDSLVTALPSNVDAPLRFVASRAETVSQRTLNYTREPIRRSDDDSNEHASDDDADSASGDDFLDEHEDSENEKWAASHAQPAAAAAAAAAEGRLTGGQLVCPACFTLVCHASRDVSTKQQMQFVAPVLVNCDVSRTEVLRSLDDDDDDGGDAPELFAPVTCRTCNTEVGLFSAGEQRTYLFHVLPST